MSISSLLVPAILFFALGMFACIIKSDLKFPPDMHKMIVIYLLIGIGLHGGKALATSNMGDALPAVWAALAFGVGLPIIAYIILRALGKIDPLNAAAISAHYGSVSAGTYMTAVAFLGGIGITYEAYPVIMLAIMESPAIMIGLVLAGYSRKVMGGATKADNIDKTKSAAAGAKESTSDTWITTKVKADLVTEKGIPGTDIKVETNKGVVSLSSTAPVTEAQKTTAVNITKKIKGVKAVSADGLKAE